MARPGWQSNQTDIGRTNRIFRLIASEFGPQHHTVAAIQPMNESASSSHSARHVADQKLGQPDFTGKTCLMPCANIGWIHIRAQSVVGEHLAINP